MQSQLEEGVGGLLQAHSRVLGLLAADAQSPNMAQARKLGLVRAGQAVDSRLGGLSRFGWLL